MRGLRYLKTCSLLLVSSNTSIVYNTKTKAGTQGVGFNTDRQLCTSFYLSMIQSKCWITLCADDMLLDCQTIWLNNIVHSIDYRPIL